MMWRLKTATCSITKGHVMHIRGVFFLLPKLSSHYKLLYLLLKKIPFFATKKFLLPKYTPEKQVLLKSILTSSLFLCCLNTSITRYPIDNNHGYF